MLCVQWKRPLYTRKTPHAVHIMEKPLYTRETPTAVHTREKNTIYEANVLSCAYKGKSPYILGKGLILCIQEKSPLNTREMPYTVHTMEKHPIY